MPGWLAPALLMAGGTLSGALSGRQAAQSSFQDRQQRRDLAYAAIDQMDAPRIAQEFAALQGIQAPFLNQLLAGQDLAGQQTAGALRAGLARQGLGATGLGASLGAGARAGAAFQGNMLRARMLSDLMQQAIGIRSGQAQILGGLSTNPGMPTTQTALTGGVSGFGGGLTAAGLLFPSLFGQQSQGK